MCPFSSDFVFFFGNCFSALRGREGGAMHSTAFLSILCGTENFSLLIAANDFRPNPEQLTAIDKMPRTRREREIANDVAKQEIAVLSNGIFCSSEMTDNETSAVISCEQLPHSINVNRNESFQFMRQ